MYQQSVAVRPVLKCISYIEIIYIYQQMPQPIYRILGVEYNTECPNHYPSQSQQGPRIEQQQDKMVSHIYENLPTNSIVRLPHLWSSDSQGQETFLAPNADKEIRNYDTDRLNRYSLQPQRGTRIEMQ